MPTPALDPPPTPTKNKVLAAVLDFIHAMRTAPSHGGEEAIEWATLEAEFETRLQDEKAA